MTKPRKAGGPRSILIRSLISLSSHGSDIYHIYTHILITIIIIITITITLTITITIIIIYILITITIILII